MFTQHRFGWEPPRRFGRNFINRLRFVIDGCTVLQKTTSYGLHHSQPVEFSMSKTSQDNLPHSLEEHPDLWRTWHLSRIERQHGSIWLNVAIPEGQLYNHQRYKRLNPCRNPELAQYRYPFISGSVTACIFYSLENEGKNILLSNNAIWTDQRWCWTEGHKIW